MTSQSINDTKIDRTIKSSFLDDFAKSQVYKQLEKMTLGRLVIEHNGEVQCFGQSKDDAIISAQMFIHHPSAYRDILFGGSIGASESYMLGSWTTSNLVDVVRVMSMNINFINDLDESFTAI